MCILSKKGIDLVLVTEHTTYTYKVGLGPKRVFYEHPNFEESPEIFRIQAL